MCIFAAEKIKTICGKTHPFKKLYYNGLCYFEKFEEKLEDKRLIKEYKQIITYIDQYSEGVNLPANKRRVINCSEIKNAQLWEFKKGSIRIYYFEYESENIIVSGGYKKDQKRDIDRFVSIVKKYFKKTIQNDQRRIIKKFRILDN